MNSWSYPEERRAPRPRPHSRHDRDAARLLAPWRRCDGGPGSLVRRD